ncbi:MAG: ABC transporter transmembrane domain-containing protein [Spirochaetaceae bacterium]|nr:ABC transporter transmembrane domain-containing protein [Spirochaetaceae bacterium]
MSAEVPAPIKERLSATGVAERDILHAVSSDLCLDGRYGEDWAVATPDALHIVTDDGVDRLALDRIGPVQVESLVSGGLLAAGRREPDMAERLLLRFSNSRARQFGAFAGAVAALQMGDEAPAVEELREQTCPTCGLRYPDQERAVCPRCIDKRGLFARVLGYLRPYRRLAAIVAVTMLASTALKTVTPLLSGRVLFDDVLAPAGRYHGQVLPVVLLIVAVTAAGVGAQMLYQRLNARMSVHMVYDLKSQIFTALQRLSLGFFARKQTGGLMVRVNHDSMNLSGFFIDGLPFFVVNLVQIVAIVAVMVALQPGLALLLLLPAPVVVLIVKRVFPKLWRLFGRQHRSLAILNGVVDDSLSGVRVVKAFGQEQQEIERFRPANDEVRGAELRTQRTLATLFPSVAFLTQIGGLIVWAAGGWQVIGGSLTLGVLITFATYSALLYEPMRFMTMVVEYWSMAMNSAHRIFEVVDAVPEVAERTDPVALPHMHGEVELRGVTFAYEPNKPVLHDIDLTVDAGAVLGLVGHTGAGKSTLINLITRLYDTESGRVLIDGIDVRDLRIADLRRQVGIILQDPYLFDGTVSENLAYGRPDATHAQIVAAAKAAFAHDFIARLPDGYDTRVGPRGHGLSGGERQRLSIARAVLIDPRILILDEATSSVDSETEEMIQLALERLIRGRTTIAIAHRLSTLRMAHRLAVLEKGRLVEQGTHDDLEAAGGIYATLVRKQRDALKVIAIGAQR